MGNWKQLLSGGGYDLDKHEYFGRFIIRKDLIKPLAGTPRYDNHTTSPWMVAIHSVAVARTIEAVTGDKDAAAAGLGHDFHESITGDIVTPIAAVIGYDVIRALKHKIQVALELKLNIPEEKSFSVNKSIVKLGDVAALLVEKKLFTAPAPRDWGIPEPTPVWMQTMYDVVMDIVNDGEHHDGGFGAMCYEYERLIGKLGE